MKQNSTFSILLFQLIFVLMGCSTSNEEKQDQNQASNTSVPTVSADETSSKKTIIFFGNSLTAGYGLEKEQAFPQLIQQKIDKLALPYTIVNAGLSGETTAGGLGRVDWIIGQQKPDIFVLSLGGNDALRGIDPNNTKDNLEKIIDKVKKVNPQCKILLAGILPPPNMGDDYFKAFEKLYPQISKEKNTYLLPFLLEGVAGEPSLNQADGIHPNVEGAKIVANTVFKSLQPLL
ncbi:arylesterase [Flammeovirga agarivorans]|uniref:Arylesterase n=1 Tax=Flammeovirga agarivorans TaxID=2726742 RepID=A0A7X8SMT8_9BACT|nr:arylesterase [Flammeovirga agarivorans]NLR93071.1 arylesterase [Flammeovirga agarivorans]